MQQVYFDETKAPVQTVDFDYGPHDPVAERDDGDREILSAALGLWRLDAHRDLLAARCVLVFSVMNPAIKRREWLHRYPGVSRHLFDQARLELASLLGAGKKDVSVLSEMKAGAK